MTRQIEIQELPLWNKIKQKNSLLSFSIDITARCNLDCRHCYINLPAGDNNARQRELGVEEIRRIAKEAVDLGAVWCLISGGEPLLRRDFEQIYIALKRAGLLVSVYTNLTLLSLKHVDLFKRYLPRDIESTVYGVTADTYEAVTRRPGSFSAFMRGIDLLRHNNIPVRLKAMALRSNFHEFDAIAQFCNKNTKDYYRFDPLINLRTDGDKKRNREIIEERLSPEEIVYLESLDKERMETMQNNCAFYIQPYDISADERLFYCSLGLGNCNITPDGKFQLCNTLVAPELMFDLRQGSLRQAWEEFAPGIRNLPLQANAKEMSCRHCRLINLCMWCPATAHLETGDFNGVVDYYCRMATLRAKALQKKSQSD
jgi:radical SAM protein with 4Fe4S-binding SPASM domain